jgi:hypothetical protein
MTMTERILAAFRVGDRGEALSRLVNELAAEGHSKAAIMSAIDSTREQMLRSEAWLETDEDLYVDVMDGLTGWCHPSGWLLPDQEPLPPGRDQAESGSRGAE